MNILVTGGAGFIGSNFIHLLLGHRQSDRLINFDALTYAGNLDNLDDIHEGATYRFIKGDIADKETIKKVLSNYQINVIVNFAAQSHVDRSIIDTTPFVHTNIEVSIRYWKLLGSITSLNLCRFRLMRFMAAHLPKRALTSRPLLIQVHHMRQLKHLPIYWHFPTLRHLARRFV